MAFTVEFDDDGKIQQVFNGGLQKTMTGSAKKPSASPAMLTEHLKKPDGTLHPVKHITSVVIVKANPICVWQDGILYCL